jgi:hypothetical protein
LRSELPAWLKFPAGASPRPENHSGPESERQDLELLQNALREPGRELFVWRLSTLRPPYAVSDSLLRIADREPWRGTTVEHTLETHLALRLGHARRVAAEPAPARRLHPGESLDPYRRVVEAAHLSADHWIGTIAETLAAECGGGGWSLVVTATASTALGEHDRLGLHAGVTPQQIRVPLLWILPNGSRAGERRPEPVLVRDLASSLLHDPASKSGVDLLGDLDARRTRFHLGYHRNIRSTEPGRQEHPFGEAGYSNGEWRYRLASNGHEHLADLSHDPNAFVNLASAESTLSRRARAELLEHFGLRRQELVVLAREVDRSRSLELRLSVDPAPIQVQGRGLEPFDRIQSGAQRPGEPEIVLLTDPMGDAVALRLPEPLRVLRLRRSVDPAFAELEPLPIRLGRGGPPLPDAERRLRLFEESYLLAIVRAPELDLEQWLKEQAAGIYIWIRAEDEQL